MRCYFCENQKVCALVPHTVGKVKIQVYVCKRCAESKVN